MSFVIYNFVYKILDISDCFYSYETSGGIKHEEDGNVPNPEAEEPSISVRGSYSFVADDGQTYTVNYVADENGYRPEGAHLPKA